MRDRVRSIPLRTLGLALALAPIANPRAEAPPPPDATDCVTLIANAGVRIEAPGTRVLVDALFDPGLPEYGGPTDAQRADRAAGRGLFFDVALAAITHGHSDHADATTVAAFQRRSPDTLIVAPEDWILRAPDAARAPAVRWRAAEAGRFVVNEGVRLEVLALSHGALARRIDHVGYRVVIGDFDVLHAGDAEARALREARGYGDPDVLVLPYWHALEDPAGDDVLARHPHATILLVHAPVGPQGDVSLGARGPWSRLRATLLARHPRAVILDEPGARWCRPRPASPPTA